MHYEVKKEKHLIHSQEIDVIHQLKDTVSLSVFRDDSGTISQAID